MIREMLCWRPRRLRKRNQRRRLVVESLNQRSLLSADGFESLLLSDRGLTAEFYTSDDLSPENLAFVRTDPTIQFDWGIGSPDPARLPADNFSVRWSGQLIPQFSASHSLIVQGGGDDGIRLRIGGNVLIEAWNARSDRPFETSIDLVAGQPVEFQLDYREGTGKAAISVQIESSHSAQVPLPTSQLIPRQQVTTATGVIVENLATEDTTAATSFINETLTIPPTENEDASSPAQRLRTLIRPPENGYYTFHLASAGVSELWLSNDVNDANAVKIAEVTSGVEVQSYQQHETQSSEPVFLVHGEAYLLSALHDRNDHFSVAWQTPSNPEIQEITAENLHRMVPVVEVESVVSAADETTSKSAAVKFTRSGEFGRELTVAYTLGGSAIHDVDYETSGELGTITFPVGSREVELTLTPFEDQETEGLEDIVVRLAASPDSEYLLHTESRQVVKVLLADDASANGSGLPVYERRGERNEILQSAKERITDKQLPFTIRVQDGDGNPIEGATVQADLVQHAFGFSAVQPTSSSEEEANRYSAVLNSLFNGDVHGEAQEIIWGRPSWDSDPFFASINLESLQADVVELDAAFLERELPSLANIETTLRRYEELPNVAISEFGIEGSQLDQQGLADFTRDLMTLAFASPNASRISFGDLQAGQYNEDWTINPTGQTVHDLIEREWQTNARGTTRTNGQYTFPGFAGHYHVAVNFNGLSEQVEGKFFTGENGQPNLIITLGDRDQQLLVSQIDDRVVVHDVLGDVRSDRRIHDNFLQLVYTNERDDLVVVEELASDVAIRITTYGGDDVIRLSSLGSAVVNGGRGFDRLELLGNNNMDLRQQGGSLMYGIEVLDLRGGSTVVTLDAQSVREISLFHELTVIFDTNSSIDLVEDWEFSSLQQTDGKWSHQLSRDGSILRLTNDNPWQNPVEPLDVDQNGQVTSLDALLVINELNLNPEGELAIPNDSYGPTTRFLDANGSASVSALDALLIINQLGGVTGVDGEQIASQAAHNMETNTSKQLSDIPQPTVEDLAANIKSLPSTQQLDEFFQQLGALEESSDQYRRFDEPEVRSLKNSVHLLSQQSSSLLGW